MKSFKELFEGKALKGYQGNSDYMISDHIKINVINTLPANKKLMKLIQIAILTWLTDAEQEKGKPNFALSDGSMDARTTWFELENGDYDAAKELMDNWDGDISKMIAKLKTKKRS